MNDVVSAARSWLGTPFALHGRVKLKGCDCLGLIMGVAQELGLQDKYGKKISALDQGNYYMFGNYADLLMVFDMHFKMSPKVFVGGLGLFNFDRDNAHLGIIGDYPGGRFSVIHSCMGIGKVVEHRLCGTFKDNLIQVYEFGK